MILRNILQNNRSKILLKNFRKVHCQNSQVLFLFFESIARRYYAKNFVKFIRKHLCQSLFFNKVAGPGLQLYKKRDSGTYRCLFSCKFCKLFIQNTFFHRTPLIKQSYRPRDFSEQLVFRTPVSYFLIQRH